MVPQTAWFGKAPKGRKVEMNFNGGNITSDAGVIPLKLVDDKINLLGRVAKMVEDPRNQALVKHKVSAILKQRVYALALGYADGNDHDRLRKDLAFQAAVERDRDLASSPTMCRMENWATRKLAWDTHKVMLDTFIESFDEPPCQIILDFDATDDRIYGEQFGSGFNAYYDHYIFLPLVVTCGDQLLVNYLRPGRSDAALHAGAILRILVSEIRKRWPHVKIIFRADSGFCRKHILEWCERNEVLYIVGLAKNSRLNKMADIFALRAQYKFEETQVKSRILDSFFYAAGTWKNIHRKVVCRAEYGDQGIDLRYIVTNIKGSSKALYEDIYCMRGHAENHIKDLKLTMFSDRTSCVDWDANQFRVLLSSLAYILMENLRRLGLDEQDPAFSNEPTEQEDLKSCKETYGTSIATDGRTGKVHRQQQTSFETIRLRLLKIGAVVVRNTRRIRIMMSESCPLKVRFMEMMARLSPA